MQRFTAGTFSQWFFFISTLFMCIDFISLFFFFPVACAVSCDVTRNAKNITKYFSHDLIKGPLQAIYRPVHEWMNEWVSEWVLVVLENERKRRKKMWISFAISIVFCVYNEIVLSIMLYSVMMSANDNFPLFFIASTDIVINNIKINCYKFFYFIFFSFSFSYLFISHSYFPIRSRSIIHSFIVVCVPLCLK